MGEPYEIAIKSQKRQNIAKRGMAKSMLNAWNSVPHFVQMANANAENLMKVKKELKDVSYNDILIRAMINAVKDVPEINSALVGDDLVIYEDINVSVAVVTDAGLFVPVIRQADKMSVFDISKAVKDIAAKIAAGQFTLDDMAHGTITISNLGATAVETGTPIINTPQGALVFMGAIRKEPVVNENDEIVVGHVVGYSIGYDHRFIDGMTAQKFTTRFKQEIESISVDKLQ